MYKTAAIVALVAFWCLQGCRDHDKETMYVFSGTVVDSLSSVPLDEARVFIGDTTNAPNDITDFTGTFNVAIYGVKTSLTVSHDGYYSKTKVVDGRIQSRGIVFQLVPR